MSDSMSRVTGRRPYGIRGAIPISLMFAVLGACAEGGRSPTAFPDTSAPRSSDTAGATAPSTSFAPTTLPRLPGTSRIVIETGSVIRVQHDDGVAAGLLQKVTDGLMAARNDLGDSGPVEVFLYSNADDYVEAYSTRTGTAPDLIRSSLPNRRGITRGAEIWFYGPNFVGGEQVNVIHEYFHTLQNALGRSRSVPLWLQEGSADYFMYRVGAAYGYTGGTSFENYQRFSVQRAKASPARLAELENSTRSISGSDSARTDALGYHWGFVAVDYLVNSYGLQKIAYDYWVALSSADWREAFRAVFGLSVDEFYEEFSRYQEAL